MGWIEDGVLHELWKVNQRPLYADALRSASDKNVADAALKAAHHIREEAVELSWRRVALGMQPLNHRHFYVGGLAIGIVQRGRNGDHDWWVSAAWNTKPQPGDEKYCSEKRLGKRALKSGCRCVVSIAVVGERNDDSRSGISYKTLEPCESCRDDMRGTFRSLYRRDTRILMENPHNATRSIKTVSQLMRGHGEAWP